MYKIIYSLAWLSMLVFSLNANAEQSLTKPLIQQYSNTMEKLMPLTDGYSDFDGKMLKAMGQGKSEMLSLISTLPTYPKIKATVVDSGFDNVDDFLDIGLRVMGGLVSQQEAMIPGGMTIDTYVEQLKSQMSLMDQQELPPQVLAQMKSTLSEQLSVFEMMQGMAKHASAEDIKFVESNLEWVTAQMDTDDKDSL